MRLARRNVQTTHSGKLTRVVLQPKRRAVCSQWAVQPRLVFRAMPYGNLEILFRVGILAILRTYRSHTKLFAGNAAPFFHRAATKTKTADFFCFFVSFILGQNLWTVG